jgi:hypothetical protein
MFAQVPIANTFNGLAKILTAAEKKSAAHVIDYARSLCECELVYALHVCVSLIDKTPRRKFIFPAASKLNLLDPVLLSRSAPCVTHSRSSPSFIFLSFPD